MSLSILPQSFIAIFTILFAIGSICMTVINTTILHGVGVGIFAGLGAVCADTVYIVLASLIMYALKTILQSNTVIVVGICGGLFLYYLAYKFWYFKPASRGKRVHSDRLKSFVALFSLTLTGPTTIISYSVVFLSFLGNESFDALSAIIGGFMGTFLFYLMVVSVVSIIRKKINEKKIIILNKTATIIIATMATLLIIRNLRVLFA